MARICVGGVDVDVSVDHTIGRLEQGCDVHESWFVVICFVVTGITIMKMILNDFSIQGVCFMTSGI